MSNRFSSEDLQILDPLESLRRLEPQFFASGRFSCEEAAASILTEILLIGASDVTVRRIDQWTVIFSSTDWLDEGGADMSAPAFSRVVPYLAGGQNSMRPEVLLTVFASDVFTSLDGAAVRIKGDSESFLLSNSDVVHLGRRVVGFYVQ